MDLVITISGLHGTGKSTYASSVADEFSLRHISAGELFRQIAAEQKISLVELSREAEKNYKIDRLVDDRTGIEIKKGQIVVDGLLAGWMARGCIALKIYLSAPYETRICRIASRDGLTYPEAERLTVLRERVERRRFKKLYDIDIDDLSIYDLILNTSLLSIESNIKVIKSFVREYIKYYGEI